MDFEEIKKLLELGGGKCAVYREGEPGYVIFSSVEFQKLFEKDKKPSFSTENDVSDGRIGEETGDDDFRDFQTEDPSLDAIRIEDLPL